MGQTPEQIPHQKTYTDVRETHKKMLHIMCRQGHTD